MSRSAYWHIGPVKLQIKLFIIGENLLPQFGVRELSDIPKKKLAPIRREQVSVISASGGVQFAA